MNKVLYFTRGGNTAKIAQRVAKGAGCEAAPIDAAGELKDINVLFLGGSLYIGKLDKALHEFIAKLEPGCAKHIVIFGSAARASTSTKEIEELLLPKNMQIADSLFVRGQFMFMSKGHPNEDDFAQAESFGKTVAEKFA